ncbi:transposase [Bdellovibrio svalbardensis]|uniref:transposase n=1 Tax=Bdellovibrio svalbardensis TaxID=2972972 RepID=UPI0038995904
MPRPKHIVSSDFPYHVTARCHNQNFFFDLELEAVWRIMQRHLIELQSEYKFQIHAFLLMGNHFHLLTTTPDGNLSEGMHYFMSSSSKCINLMSQKKNQVYGDRFHRSLIRNDHYLFNVLKYTYRNPVEAGICNKVEEYRYSTLQECLGLKESSLNFKNSFIDSLNESPQAILRWLNTQPRKENTEAISKALLRANFKLAKCRTRNMPHPLEHQKY